MIEKIEAVLYAPHVRSFVFEHPYLVWAGLTLVLSSLILAPVLRKWPKKAK
jgi:hypothetical protein